MLKVISGADAGCDQALMEQVYRFRHRMFVDRLGWTALRKDDGREIDQFDNADALHLVDVTEGRVTAYTRLLPTTRPHLLDTVYPELLGGASAPSHPLTFEWTRLACVDSEGSAVSTSMRRLFVGLVELCLSKGVRSLVAETDPIWITRLLQLGWEARPLALPILIEGKPVVALEAFATERTLDVSRRSLRVRYQVLPDELPAMFHELSIYREQAA